MAPNLLTQVLHALKDAGALPLTSTVAFPDLESQVLKGALDSLQSREMVTYETVDKEVAVLTAEGAGIVQNGSHEAKVYEAVCKTLDGLKINELAVSQSGAARTRMRLLMHGRKLWELLRRRLGKARLPRKVGSRRMEIGG
jgi:predicted transcriptional regulator